MRGSVFQVLRMLYVPLVLKKSDLWCHLTGSRAPSTFLIAIPSSAASVVHQSSSETLSEGLF